MKALILLLAIIFASNLFSQVKKFGFDKIVQNKSIIKMPFAISNEGEKTLKMLFSEGIKPTMISKDWVFVTTTASKINDLNNRKLLKDFYFEQSKPTLMTDSTRLKAFVNEVHSGSGSLSSSFTGKNVIIGIVDDGIDFRHPDLRDSNGRTRVLHFWDHTLLDSTKNTNVPVGYGFGLEYDSSIINKHIQTMSAPSPLYPTLGGQTFHGTNVTGIAASNALADGTCKGMAPDANIIFVRTNLNFNNWTLSIAYACKYIFEKADALGMPCVINLSLGDYYGSHDGDDPAAQMIEDLLDEKPGRIVVCAAGNSGNLGKYHVRNVVNSDTTFTWLKNSPNSMYGANTIYFDLWAAQADMANVNYALGANLPSGSYSSRAKTIFRNAFIGINNVVYDTLKNENGQRIATIEVYPSIENGNYRLQMYFSKIDSTSYNYSFYTTGTGKYDLWSGASLGLNSFVTTVPTSAEFPGIVNYVMADSLQSLVSSWACSEKVITVGNYMNRQSYKDKNGNIKTYTVPTGQLSVNSSKGPSRKDVVKPDVAAPGDVTFTASSLSYLSNPAHFNKIDSSGWHQGNGGTSMASPVVTGIAALYLERCNKATYADFKNDLTTSTYSDNFTTQNLPNFAYGFGKVNALSTLEKRNYNVSITGDSILCDSLVFLALTPASAIDSAYWVSNDSLIKGTSINLGVIGQYNVKSFDHKACVENTAYKLRDGIKLPKPIIADTNGVISSTLSENYTWYFENMIVDGQTSQVFNGEYKTGTYQVSSKSIDGCITYSDTLVVKGTLSVEKMINEFSIYPNPVSNKLIIQGVDNFDKIKIEDLSGKIVYEKDSNGKEINIEYLNKGLYILKVYRGQDFFKSKFEKL